MSKFHWLNISILTAVV